MDIYTGRNIAVIFDYGHRTWEVHGEIFAVAHGEGWTEVRMILSRPRVEVDIKDWSTTQEGEP